MSRKESKEPKAKKNESELTEAHMARVDRCTENVAKWMAKLSKALKSKKYPLSEAQKAQVLDYLENSRQDFVNAISNTEPTQKPGFKVDRRY
ncbi:MAG: hypothetical protein A2Z74_04725 [Chloroflexi bacterium RBG_13_46_9]|nr:MAG: hypothetical protein A2Z74_04725 [Chloroflexi bacterium RBG_13_46_9]